MDDQDIRKLAERVIDEVIKASLERFASSQATFNRIEEKENIEWPPAEGFTWETGLKSLESFVTTWNVSDKWKYCIDFLGHKEGKYEYRIVWSIPTRRKPVPRATASVYFTLVPQLSEVRTGHVHITWFRLILDQIVLCVLHFGPFLFAVCNNPCVLCV